MRADVTILLFATSAAFTAPSPLTWKKLTNSLLPSWTRNPSSPFNRSPREEYTPSLADLFTSEAGAFIRSEKESDEKDSNSLEGFSSESYPPESENFTPELQNITTEFHSDIIGPSGQDQTIYDLYNKDNIFPLVPSSEDSSSEYSNVSSADKVESTNSISTSELDELASSLTRAGEMVAAAMRGVRSLVMTALQTPLWQSLTGRPTPSSSTDGDADSPLREDFSILALISQFISSLLQNRSESSSDFSPPGIKLSINWLRLGGPQSKAENSSWQHSWPRSSSARFFFPSPTSDDSSAGNDVVANVADMVANQGVVKAVQHMLHHVMHDIMVTGTETAYRVYFSELVHRTGEGAADCAAREAASEPASGSSPWWTTDQWWRPRPFLPLVIPLF